MSFVLDGITFEIFIFKTYKHGFYTDETITDRMYTFRETVITCFPIPINGPNPSVHSQGSIISCFFYSYSFILKTLFDLVSGIRNKKKRM